MVVVGSPKFIEPNLSSGADGAKSEKTAAECYPNCSFLRKHVRIKFIVVDFYLFSAKINKCFIVVVVRLLLFIFVVWCVLSSLRPPAWPYPSLA